MIVQASNDGGATFTLGADIETYSIGAIAVAGGGTLAGVISSWTGLLWLYDVPQPDPTPVLPSFRLPARRRIYTLHTRAPKAF